MGNYCLFTNMDASTGTALGIDLGSEKITIAHVKKNGIDIILNEASNRSTPSIIGFLGTERNLGEPALSKQKSNYKNTIAYLTRFIGLPTKNPSTNDEAKWVSCKLCDNNGLIGYKLR